MIELYAMLNSVPSPFQDAQILCLFLLDTDLEYAAHSEPSACFCEFISIPRRYRSQS